MGSMTRFVNPASFAEVAGKDGQLVVVILPEGQYEFVVPEGAEVDEMSVPDNETSALLTLRSASYYEKCKNGWVWVCCNGFCRKKSPAQAC